MPYNDSVLALYKEDSENYLKCVIYSATKKEAIGYYTYTPKPGFGVYLNEDKLKGICDLYLEI